MTAPRSAPTSHPDDDPTSISGVVDLVKTYAKQETVGPLKGAGRWLAMGRRARSCSASACRRAARHPPAHPDRVGRGRLSGSLSWLPYLIVLVLGVGCILA